MEEFQIRSEEDIEAVIDEIKQHAEPGFTVELDVRGGDFFIPGELVETEFGDSGTVVEMVNKHSIGVEISGEVEYFDHTELAK